MKKYKIKYISIFLSTLQIRPFPLQLLILFWEYIYCLNSSYFQNIWMFYCWTINKTFALVCSFLLVIPITSVLMVVIRRPTVLHSTSKTLFNLCSLVYISTVKTVPSAYLMLFIFLPPIFMLSTCSNSSITLCEYSENRPGDNIQHALLPSLF